MTADEVAEIVRVPVKTVYLWLRKGRIKGYKFGGFWRVKRSDFEAFQIESRHDEKEADA